jgi:hypothetical protein
MDEPRIFDWWINLSDWALPLRIGARAHRRWGPDPAADGLKAVELSVSVGPVVLNFFFKLEG